MLFLVLPAVVHCPWTLVLSRISSGSVVVPGPSRELFASLCCGGYSKKIIAVASSAGL